MIKSKAIFTLICLSTVLISAHADISASTPHGHKGILTPYSGEPERISLTDADFQHLKEGKAVFKKHLIGENKRAVVITRVKADAATIWSVIKDFNSYPEWIDDIQSTQIYRQEGNTVYVRFVADIPYSGKVTWFARHDYPGETREWGTWTLDYDRLSDIEDSVGFWRVTSDPVNPAYSLVFYSTSLKLKTWAPQFIVSLIINARLEESTQWVGKQSESRMISKN